MRLLSELIEEVRFNTNKPDDSRYTDEALIRLFNNAQRAIQKIIFTAYPSNNIFGKEQVLNLEAGKSEYSLPSDIYATSAITAVLVSSFPQPVKKITSKERRSGFGYYVIGNKLYFSPEPKTTIVNGLSIVYERRLDPAENVTDSYDMPDVVENYLNLHVERRIEAIDNSTSVSDMQLLTQEERNDLINLFKDNNQDTKYPPLTDTDLYFI